MALPLAHYELVIPSWPPQAGGARNLFFLSAYRNTCNVSACIFPFVLNKLFS